MRRTLVVALLALLATAAPAHALTRNQADAIAKRILEPDQYPDAVLYRLPKPLYWFVGGAPVVVSEEGPSGPRGFQIAAADREHVTVTSASSQIFAVKHGAVWFYWEDLAHGANFEHPSRVLLLDAATGAVVDERTFEWRPLIDGKPPAFLDSPEAGQDPRYVVFSSVPLRAEQHRVSTSGPTVVPAGFMHDDCLVTIGDRSQEEDFRGDLEDFAQWAAHVGMRSFPLPADSVGTDLVRRVHELAAEGPDACRNIVIVLAGHGAPWPGYSDPHAAGSRVPSVATEFGIHRTASGGIEFDDGYVRGPDLEKLLAENQQTSFELLVDSCFSGRWGVDLTNWASDHHLANLLLVATSANSVETSVGHVDNGVPWDPGQPRGEHPSYGWWWAKKAPTFVTNAVANPATPPRQDPAESDWTHAVVDELYRWSDNQSVFQYGNEPPTPFVEELSRAALAGRNNFVAMTLHWTDPGYFAISRRFVEYRYDVKIAVSNATATWSSGTPSSGSGTASWVWDFQDSAFDVSRWDRLAYARFSGLTGTVDASGHEQAGSPPSQGWDCSWRLNDPLSNLVNTGFRFSLLEVGGDLATGKTTLADSFQYTGQLLLQPQAEDAASGIRYMQCSGLDMSQSPLVDFPVQGPGGGFIGAHCVAGGGPGPIAIPVWRLGEKTISLTGTIVPQCTASVGVVHASGTYSVTLTLIHPHRVG